MKGLMMAKKSVVVRTESDGAEKLLVEMSERFSTKRAIGWLRVKFPSLRTSRLVQFNFAKKILQSAVTGGVEDAVKMMRRKTDCGKAASSPRGPAICIGRFATLR